MKRLNKNYPLYSVVSFSTIREMMDIAVQKDGQKDAFRFFDKDRNVKSVTYSEFYEETTILGSGLYSLGIGESHIAIAAENSYRWICAYLTVLMSNGVFVPVDRELPFEDIINVMDDSDSEVLFYSSRFEKNIKENIDKFSRIRYFIGISDDARSDGDRFISFDDLKKLGKKYFDAGNTDYLKANSAPEALKLLVYTSGTTGTAKGVMLTEHNLVSSVYFGLQVSTVFDVCLSVLPYNHTYEAVSGLLVALHHHSTVCINDNLKNVLKNLNIFKPDYVYLVPAFAEVFYKRIMANAKKSGKEKVLFRMISLNKKLRKVGIDMSKVLFREIHQAFGGNLKKIVCGGAPIRAELGEFFDGIGILLVNGYGITECSPLVSANRDYFNDCSTVGVPLPCAKIKFDGINFEGLGEICVQGDIVMKGYYKHPEWTAQVLDEDGWFHTGDYGRMNDKGQLIITGRKKNIIILNNGKNIFPEEIENYIASIPYVNEVVVYGHRDESGQECAIYAEMFLSQEKLKESGIENPAEQVKADVSAALSKLPEYKKVSKIILRDTEFEKTTTNKIKRNKINRL